MTLSRRLTTSCVTALALGLLVVLSACSSNDTSLGPAPAPTTTTPGSTVTVPNTSTGDSGASANECSGAAADACEACINQKCCSPVVACETDAACKAYDDCAMQCETTSQTDPQYSQCESACLAKNPTARTKANAMNQCIDTSCAAQCS